MPLRAREREEECTRENNKTIVGNLLKSLISKNPLHPTAGRVGISAFGCHYVFTLLKRPHVAQVLKAFWQWAISNNAGCIRGTYFGAEGIKRGSFFPSLVYEVVMNNSTGEQRIFKGLFPIFYFCFILFFFILGKYNGIRDLFQTRRINNVLLAVTRVKITLQYIQYTLTSQQLQISSDFSCGFLDDMCHAARRYCWHRHYDRDRGRTAYEDRAYLPVHARNIAESETVKIVSVSH